MPETSHNFGNHSLICILQTK